MLVFAQEQYTWHVRISGLMIIFTANIDNIKVHEKKILITFGVG